MPQLIGSTSNKSQLSQAVLQSVTITAGAGGAASVSIYRDNLTSGEPIVKLYSPQGETSQYYFNDVPLPDGFTVVPNANTDFFMVEYG